MKVNKYDFYSTIYGIILFICLAAFIALIMSCGTVRSVDSDICKHVLIKDTCQCTKCGIKPVDPFTYSTQIVEPEFEETKECNHQWITCTVNPPFDKCMKCGILGKDYFEKSIGLQEWEAFGEVYTPSTMDDIIEWHGYIIIDVQDSLIIIKNQ